MKKVIITSLIVMMIAGIALAIKTDDGRKLTGKHYNLNIIASKEKNVDPDEGVSNGRRIFVKSGGNTRILLREGPFDVLDYDGTDGVAKFQLPHPDIDETADTEPTYSDYSVFMRVRGKPGGSIQMQTIGIDDEGAEYGSDYMVVQVRTTGKGTSKFTNVSKELLYLYAWVYDWNKEIWEYVRLPLFDERLEEYLWDVNTNSDFKIAQLRFYPVKTEIPAIDPQNPAPTDPPTIP